MIGEHDLKDIKGVGSGKAKKLEDAGYKDVIAVARSSARVLSEEVTGLGEDGAQNIIDAAREMLRGKSEKFQTGSEVEDYQNSLKSITTSSEKLDGLLQGGIPTEYTTEVYGQFSSGKTQLSHQLAVNVQLPEDEGGLGKGAVFIDTEETFRADRIRQMAEAHGMDPEETLDNIHVTQPEDAAEQAQAVKDAMSELDLSDKGILIVDSVMAHFRSEYSGRGELGERQDRIGAMLKNLRGIASGYNMAVFYTNQAYEDPGGGWGDNVSATGGNVVKHNGSFRLYLTDRQGNGWAAELVDSPMLPQEEVYFNVTEEGIRDV